MKALKITLVLAFLAASLTSCVKQDLNEDDVLVSPVNEIPSPFTGGSGHDQ
ncbi:hypothetical protein H7U19_01390 [Hyunsoonleella sp. SJ7]|uniref:Lipoprotein n=1 Tax=Hyunsoonleella aquatilis TaxID=2762758 RepID=A0A923H870_9FLAO|nr:hypothetical protein [Hyunsoonleella aquatilis]MBC3757039.1 hypothetical protein [Hyunsoonleella aquatilis]